MKHRLWLVALLFALPFFAQAHVGSPDIFYDGMAGPYPVRVTVRMPMVVPGRAEILTHVESAQPVQVSFRPLYADTPVSNAPPPDMGVQIRGETNFYTGDLWLMTFGGYSIEVNIHGAAGDGTVEIPVNSLALKQLPMPPFLGKLLVALAALLVCGGIATAAGAAREGVLEPGQVATFRERCKGWIGGAVMAGVFAFILIGGNAWWKSDEREFQRHLHTGGWPDMTAKVRVEGSERILDLTIGKKAFHQNDSLDLLPDHGKLLHFFLIQEGAQDAFAHIHPVRNGGKTFSVALPPLPAGNYKMLCDMTLEGSGLSLTATNSVTIPAAPESQSTNSKITLEPDADDSWIAYGEQSIPANSASNLVYTLPNGGRVIWKAHPPLRVKQDAGLQFQVLDASGNPAELEPYMGMLCHAAVMRRDETVFAHLHPSGNFSMAAQGFYQQKMARESGGDTSSDPMAGMDHSKMDHSRMGHMHHATNAEVSLPYEFPAAGDYRLWVQFKTAGQVQTAVFNASVAAQE